MKMASVIVVAVLLVGCERSQPRASLSAGQATRLAIELANARAEATYHRQPFQDGRPARFESGRWFWSALAPGDLEATVELAADGSTNHVTLDLLSNVNLYF
jgi:hypothetical protein